MSDAIVEYATTQNIAIVVVGRGPAQRWGRRSMSDAIASAAESIDVIEIGRGGTEAGTPVAAPAFKPADVASPRMPEKRLRYLWTVISCALRVSAVKHLLSTSTRLTSSSAFNRCPYAKLDTVQA